MRRLYVEAPLLFSWRVSRRDLRQGDDEPWGCYSLSLVAKRPTIQQKKKTNVYPHPCNAKHTTSSKLRMGPCFFERSLTVFDGTKFALLTLRKTATLISKLRCCRTTSEKEKQPAAFLDELYTLVGCIFALATTYEPTRGQPTRYFSWVTAVE